MLYSSQTSLTGPPSTKSENLSERVIRHTTSSLGLQQSFQIRADDTTYSNSNGRITQTRFDR